MNFHTRKWVKPEDLNPNGTLFGGSLLRWIDEEAAIYAIVNTLCEFLKLSRYSSNECILHSLSSLFA